MFYTLCGRQQSNVWSSIQNEYLSWYKCVQIDLILFLFSINLRIVFNLILDLQGDEPGDGLKNYSHYNEHLSIFRVGSYGRKYHPFRNFWTKFKCLPKFCCLFYRKVAFFGCFGKQKFFHFGFPDLKWNSQTNLEILRK